ncbi:carboxypeptidase-like regulatory domain-containing protein [Flagellimonas sp. HMM57]|uniref:carboxypeptidase-like regulatory domain-containing protein n=1 Tax=unclassified Flagellimonas TaxID=2644544 RepID=UPI001F0B6498|nr:MULTISPECIES: carboxypeptidase-like regulatory domain-containing protein [unclassified Flagellimonas]UII74976.1 carboxypeptidase-like regulatory domain-containing protein [Flagellimonas sp. HMM57]
MKNITMQYIKFVAFTFSFFFFQLNTSAQTITSKIIDSKTKQPIPYATVQYGENQGVITNEEGRFSFELNESEQRLDSIYVSSMGYAKTGISFEQVLDSVIPITPKAIELSGIYLFDKELSVDDIMEKVEERLPMNYNSAPLKQRFFLRQSSFNTLQKLDIEFKKSTIQELDKKLIDSIVTILPRNSQYYTETLGDFYRSDEQNKLEVIKAAELYDKSNEGSMEALSDKLETIFKANVKPDSYLKIKSGIFGQKVQVDSILDAEEDTDELEAELKEPKKSDFLGNRKYVLNEIHNQLFGKKTKLDVVKKLNRYDFELLGYSELENQGVYIIGYEPSRRGDFRGKLFVNIEDFAIMRIDYTNVNPLKSIKLLGFSYREQTYKGSTVFSKFGKDKYSIKFMALTFGRKMGVDRPLKVIEKNKHVKGRRKQNELSLALDVINYNTEKFEMVVFDSNTIPKSSLEGITEDETIKATYLSAYNPEFWKGYNIMEPNQAIREFTVTE